MTELSMGEISEVFKEYAEELNIPVRDIMFSTDGKNTITIYTDIPGLLIGKAGSTIEKYKKKLNALVTEHNDIIKQINSKPDREYTIPEMPEVKFNIIEVTRANFWLNYNSMGECF